MNSIISVLIVFLTPRLIWFQLMFFYSHHTLDLLLACLEQRAGKAIRSQIAEGNSQMNPVILFAATQPSPMIVGASATGAHRRRVLAIKDIEHLQQERYNFKL